MSEFKEIVANFMLVAIFTIGLFTFMVVLQNNNDAPQPLIDDSVFNDSFSTLGLAINNATEEANEKYDVFNSENPKPGFGSIVLFGIVSVGKTFSNIIFGFFWALIKFPLIILGVPATVYSLLIVWLIISVIVAVWLLYKLGG